MSIEKQRLVYLAHPVGAPDAAGVRANLERAKRWVAYVYRVYPDVSPVAPYITGAEVMDDHVPEQRSHGMRCNLTLLARCDEVWLCGGRVSPGMQVEADFARDAGVLVVDLCVCGSEPPAAA